MPIDSQYSYPATPIPCFSKVKLKASKKKTEK